MEHLKIQLSRTKIRSQATLNAAETQNSVKMN